MDNTQALTPLRESDYDAIEAAVMETEKGRWFLAEYASRHRHANTTSIVDAIGRLETLLKRERRPDADRIRLDIGEMKDAIERTKLEIAQIKSDGHGPLSRFERASSELDAIVEQTEAATSEILGAAEKIQEIAFTMREAGVEDAICDDVENLTTTIYMACSFQDLTGQRTQKVVQVLRYLENRINAMIHIWGMDDSEVAQGSATARTPANPMDHRPDAHLLNGPALAGEGIEQTLVDDILVEDAAADAATMQAIAAKAINDGDFDRIDAMAALGKAQDGAEAAPEIDINAIDINNIDINSIDFDAIDIDSIEFDHIARDDVPAPGAAAEAEVESVAEEAIEDIAFEEIATVDLVEEAVETPAGAAETAPVSDAELSLASEGVDTAIEALKEVTEAVRAKNTAIENDPFDAMTKTERQALFS